MNGTPDEPDGLVDTVRRQRQQRWLREGEPSIARFIGQIGVFGWIIVTPTLIGLFVGRWLDHRFESGIFLKRAIVAGRGGGRMLVGMAMDARAMTPLYAIEHDVLMLVLKNGAWLAIGGVIGAIHFLTLRWSARMLATGSSLPLALALQLIRFAIIAVALIAITQHGALPLLVATLGILASRAAVLCLGALS